MLHKLNRDCLSWTWCFSALANKAKPIKDNVEEAMDHSITLVLLLLQKHYIACVTQDWIPDGVSEKDLSNKEIWNLYHYTIKQWGRDENPHFFSQ